MKFPACGLLRLSASARSPKGIRSTAAGLSRTPPRPTEWGGHASREGPSPPPSQVWGIYRPRHVPFSLGTVPEPIRTWISAVPLSSAFLSKGGWLPGKPQAHWPAGRSTVLTGVDEAGLTVSQDLAGPGAPGHGALCRDHPFSRWCSQVWNLISQVTQRRWVSPSGDPLSQTLFCGAVLGS